MRRVLRAFVPFFTEIEHNFMLVACIIGPVLMGAAFRFLIPVLEKLLCYDFDLPQVLASYYIIFDLLLVIMTPILLCFAGVLVILEELDSGVAKYYVVTPLGKGGYLLSRIGIPTLFAFVYAVIILWIFSLSKVEIGIVALLSICGAFTATLTALFVVSFAHNKMEGMALVKLCGLLLVGIPVSYFVENPVRYFFGLFPSFWMAELCRTQNEFFFIPAVLLSVVFITVLFRRFKRKLL